MAQDSSQHASRRLQDRLKTASRGQGASQGGPREAKILQKPGKKHMCFAFSPFRFRWALEASRWLQDGPRRPQERPKRGPRRPQERPRAPQDRPKRRFFGPRGGDRNKRRPLFFIDGLQDGPREAQEGPLRAPRRPQERPREPQERPKRARREAQEGPRGLQHVLKRAL